MPEAFRRPYPALNFPKAFVFDWDNTLVDSHEIIMTAINKVFEHYNKPLLTLEQARKSPQRSLKDSFPEIFGQSEWRNAQTIYHRYFSEIHLERLTPYPGSQDLLDTISALGLPMFIVSNKTQEHLEKEITALNWHHHFYSIKGSQDGQIDKPHPQALTYALKNTHIAPSKEVWFVGDSPVDAQCAISTGCLPIIVKDSINISNFKGLTEAIIFIDSLKDIKEFLAYSK